AEARDDKPGGRCPGPYTRRGCRPVGAVSSENKSPEQAGDPKASRLSVTSTVALPVMKVECASTTPIVWVPGVWSVMLKVWAPASLPENAVSSGSWAKRSVLLKWTVPVYVLAVFPHWSSAITVTLKGTPAVTWDGAARRKLTASSVSKAPM